MRFQDILNEQRFQYTVDGYGYHEIEDSPADEGEPAKKWHYMTTPGGEEITLDHSPYQWMDKDEFAVHVAKHKKGLHEAMKRPQLSIPATQQELEEAFQQLSSMCDAYEVTIEMFKDRIEELEATLAMYEGKD